MTGRLNGEESRPRSALVVTVAVSALLAAIAAPVLLTRRVAERALSMAPEFGSLIRRLPAFPSDGLSPGSWVELDIAALRRARHLMPAGARYYIHTSADLVYELNTTSVIFLPLLEVLDATKAEWVLSYRAPTLVPEGVRAGTARRLGEGIFLVRQREP